MIGSQIDRPVWTPFQENPPPAPAGGRHEGDAERVCAVLALEGLGRHVDLPFLGQGAAGGGEDLAEVLGASSQVRSLVSCTPMR